jgi:hypothetical protein
MGEISNSRPFNCGYRRHKSHVQSAKSLLYSRQNQAFDRQNQTRPIRMRARCCKQFPLLLVCLGISFIAALISLISVHRTKVFGELPASDLNEISRVIHHDLRRFELPTWSKENLKNPRYVLGSIKQYAARRILWVDVQDDRTVRAYVGDNKERIMADGWSYILHKESNWRIGGMAYWASAELAPKDFKVPAGL